MVAARERQGIRLAGTGAICNGDMDVRLVRRHVPLDRRARRRLATAADGRRVLTARGHDRVLRLARTIADLAGRDAVGAEDVDEALGFRLLDPTRVAA